ncbi:unnamed protein product [Soboliphyme baturini]|uniref:NIDO domain-containing protein n=1 Tax=Soboliphyme baturini TaxID=241478 RepID=A0A183J6R1_9BILA|nr:unnamed protein product [Soboliphyme baturini]
MTSSGRGWRVLYPFGEKAYDISVTDQPNHETQVDLNFNFPFYGFRFNYSYVTPNGLLKFSTSDWIQPPYTFPNPNWPYKKDPSFIAPFLSRATFQYVDATRISNVWYRTVHRQKHSCNPDSAFAASCLIRKRKQPGYVEDDAFLNEISDEIERGIIGANTFNALHALVVTWERMAFGGAPKVVKLEDYEKAKQWVSPCGQPASK